MFSCDGFVCWFVGDCRLVVGGNGVGCSGASSVGSYIVSGSGIESVADGGLTSGEASTVFDVSCFPSAVESVECILAPVAAVMVCEVEDSVIASVDSGSDVVAPLIREIPFYEWSSFLIDMAG